MSSTLSWFVYDLFLCLVLRLCVRSLFLFIVHCLFVFSRSLLTICKAWARP